MKPLLALAAFTLAAQPWKPLFNGKNLDGWQVVGDGRWHVLADGTLVAEPASGGNNPFGAWPVALTEKQFKDWRQTQSWLYTVAEYGEFDLHVEYRGPLNGNSGVTIRDSTRGKYAIGPAPDFEKTPAHWGYEIQIAVGSKGKYPSGSLYLFASAELGHEKVGDWNTLDIESRNDIIRVKLNGHPVSSHAGDPKRPKTGPIGLQLHDRFSGMTFRNIRIREMKK